MLKLLMLMLTILFVVANVSFDSFPPRSLPEHDIRAKWRPCEYDQFPTTQHIWIHHPHFLLLLALNNNTKPSGLSIAELASKSSLSGPEHQQCWMVRTYWNWKVKNWWWKVSRVCVAYWLTSASFGTAPIFNFDVDEQNLVRICVISRCTNSVWEVYP